MWSPDLQNSQTKLDLSFIDSITHLHLAHLQDVILIHDNRFYIDKFFQSVI